MNGSTITNTVQPALPHPDRSGRRKTSTSTVIAIQIQRAHVKKMIIVQKISMNGYEVALTMVDSSRSVVGRRSSVVADDRAAGRGADPPNRVSRTPVSRAPAPHCLCRRSPS